MGWKLGFILISVWVLGCSSVSTQKEYSKTERARMLIEVANGALVEGDPTGALQTLIRAKEEDPNLPELYHSMAIAYFLKHDLNTALLYANRAVELKPNYSDANNTLGKLLIDASQYERASSPLLKAARDPLYREAYKAWTNLGILKYRVGELHSARTYLERAILEAPEQACIAYYYRGQIEQGNQKLKEAIEDYSRATKRFCSNSSDAHYALGLAYEKNREYSLARKTFIEIHKRYPNTKVAEQALDQLKYLP